MYLTKENICDLNEIIIALNTIQNEKDKEEFLNKNIEDVNLFLTTLRKINKNKLPKIIKKILKIILTLQTILFVMKMKL